MSAKKKRKCYNFCNNLKHFDMDQEAFFDPGNARISSVFGQKNVIRYDIFDLIGAKFIEKC